jgi:hypothetical protein
LPVSLWAVSFVAHFFPSLPSQLSPEPFPEPWLSFFPSFSSFPVSTDPEPFHTLLSYLEGFLLLNLDPSSVGGLEEVFIVHEIFLVLVKTYIQDTIGHSHVDFFFKAFFGCAGIDIEGAELCEIGADGLLVFLLPELELGVGGFPSIMIFGADCGGVVRPGIRITELSVSVYVPRKRGLCQQYSYPSNLLVVGRIWVEAEEHDDQFPPTTEFGRGGAVEWFGVLHLESDGTDSSVHLFPGLSGYRLGSHDSFTDEIRDG